MRRRGGSERPVKGPRANRKARKASIAAPSVANLQKQIGILTRELKETREQQTASVEVLQVINSSFGNLARVFDAMLDKALGLCGAAFGILWTYDGAEIHAAALRGVPPAYAKFLTRSPHVVGHNNAHDRLMRGERIVHIVDAAQDEAYRSGDILRRATVELGGSRTLIAVPLRKDGMFLGDFVIYRQEVSPFSDKQIALLENFAAQAVIAMENARLFDEVRERQAELRVTFDNMGDGVAMFDAKARLAAWNRNFQEMLDLPDAFLVQRPSYIEYFRYLAERGEYSADLETELSRTINDTSREMRFERTRPDGRVIEVQRNPVIGGGVVLIYADITERKHAEAAIRAARDAAEATLRELQKTQASLVHAQKMAALGQLTAGIAHEIKNPLNFVNNFSGLSVELIEELQQTLGRLQADVETRSEITELADMLRDNLAKVVQHGKRADSIVKNMLLHSREGSGEHKRVDINALVEETLNLAYHGARAEKPGFKITLERSFDPAAGQVDVFPQDIIRVLLNLLSNGFYAATIRGSEVGDFEPKLQAATRDLGDRVEIRIRDNGTGMASEVKEKMFNPFFTTKPPGAGTGLGLSISHDIIVKHAGSIEVDTQPGEFTEIRITLPRKSVSA